MGCMVGRTGADFAEGDARKGASFIVILRFCLHSSITFTDTFTESAGAHDSLMTPPIGVEPGKTVCTEDGRYRQRFSRFRC